MLKVIKHSKFWFVFSGVLVAGSIVLIFAFGLRPGIDFRGGSLSELEFENPATSSRIQDTMNINGFKSVVIQPVSEKVVIIKTEALDEQVIAKFNEIIKSNFGNYKELRFESIGPSISRELLARAYWQIGLVLLGILLYIAYAFRNTGKQAKNFGITSWHMGFSAILALIHDIAIPIGVFVILGKYRGVEVDSLFITALLTVMGFSIHDTIVVFDRIRENLQKYPYKNFDTIIDFSVNSTLARSINTSSTLIFVLVTLLLFGGQTIFYFVLALFIGVVAGTYSSIFIASPLLYYWAKRNHRS